MPNDLPLVNTNNTDACASTAGCFSLSLPNASCEKRWAIVGAPFNESILEDNIRLLSDEAHCESGCSLTEAVDSGFLNAGMWVYDSDASDYLSITELFHLQPWQAFWTSTKTTTSTSGLTLLFPSSEPEDPEVAPDPGPVVETHHESIPNPVHSSTFRVAQRVNRHTIG